MDSDYWIVAFNSPARTSNVGDCNLVIVLCVLNACSFRTLDWYQCQILPKMKDLVEKCSHKKTPVFCSCESRTCESSKFKSSPAHSCRVNRGRAVRKCGSKFHPMQTRWRCRQFSEFCAALDEILNHIFRFRDPDLISKIWDNMQKTIQKRFGCGSENTQKPNTWNLDDVLFKT